jgi:hypothetical protein
VFVADERLARRNDGSRRGTLFTAENGEFFAEFTTLAALPRKLRYAFELGDPS